MGQDPWTLGLITTLTFPPMKTHKTHTTQPAKTTLAEAQANYFKGMTLLGVGFFCIIILAVICNSFTSRKS